MWPIVKKHLDHLTNIKDATRILRKNISARLNDLREKATTLTKNIEKLDNFSRCPTIENTFGLEIPDDQKLEIIKSLSTIIAGQDIPKSVLHTIKKCRLELCDELGDLQKEIIHHKLLKFEKIEPEDIDSDIDFLKAFKKKLKRQCITSEEAIQVSFRLEPEDSQNFLKIYHKELKNGKIVNEEGEIKEDEEYDVKAELRRYMMSIALGKDDNYSFERRQSSVISGGSLRNYAKFTKGSDEDQPFVKSVGKNFPSLSSLPPLSIPQLTTQSTNESSNNHLYENNGFVPLFP